MRDGDHERKRGGKRWGIALAVYAVLLAASHVVRWARDDAIELAPDEAMLSVRVVDGVELGEERTPLVYRDRGEADHRLPVLLLHGSPGSKDDFRWLVPGLGGRRAICPDLPGFGSSRRRGLPDYSIRAHARYTLQLLDALALARVHVVGYSMGGGVALELARLAPERVESLTLLSAIGVQELELFGSHRLNHLVHGAQLALLVALSEGVPHFGLLDDVMLSVPYARNFHHTDQRPLRGILAAWEGPMLILHGESDPLVPVAAAHEHARLVPQGELDLWAGGHLLVFTEGEAVGRRISDFLAAVDAGEARTRTGASPERRAAAEAPFDPASAPPLAGVALVIFILLAAAGTLVSEDLTCVGVGALVGQGRVGLAAGAFACFLGIYVGDMLLFFAGRTLGRRAVRYAPLRWVLDEERVARGSEWFARKGPVVILLSRFMPGARLPTYFAGGLLRTSVAQFALWFALAAALWTPILVWLSSRIGGELTERVEVLRENLLLGLGATVVAAILVVKVGVPLLHHRGRRMLVRRWRRTTRWEFWPPWVFYPPLFPYFAWLALRHGGATIFTAVNPGIRDGGLVGESKAEILRKLGSAGGRIPAWTVVAKETPRSEAAERIGVWQHGLAIRWPLVVKPDVGERGKGVCVVHDAASLRRALDATRGDAMVQEHVSGAEYGIFYARHPDAEEGTIISLTHKRLPRVRGDGRRTLERLILDDPRAVCQAPFFLGRNASRLAEVPAAGEEVVIGELGTHCKGALFLDGGHLVTPELTAAVEGVARGFAGFHFGRFDVRAPSPEALARGEFSILELNGVSSEAAHVYDPQYGVLYAWRTIAAQWALAYEIGAANARRGARITGPGKLLRAVLRHFGGKA